MSTAREVNDRKAHWVVKKVLDVAESFDGGRPVIACLGLAYKPDIDDLRESPALEIAHEIQKAGFKTLCCEPHVTGDVFEGLKLVNYADAIAQADILVHLSHQAFQAVNLRQNQR